MSPPLPPKPPTILQRQIADDLAMHLRERIRTAMMDFISRCEIMDIPPHFICQEACITLLAEACKMLFHTTKGVTAGEFARLCAQTWRVMEEAERERGD